MVNNGDQRNNDLRCAYDVFSEDHESQRDELMQLIAKKPNAVVARTVADHRWYTLNRMLAALAAVLLVMIGSLILLNSNTSVAYGIETLTQRLLAVRSLHVRGFLVQKVVNGNGEEETKQFPVRWYFERPKRLWLESYGFSDQGDSKATVVQQNNTGIDGDLRVSEDPSSGKRIMVPVDPRTSELMVELMIQSLIFEQLVHGPVDQFVKVRTEQANGIQCDVYEQKSKSVTGTSGSMQHIWLNPRNGLPVRVDIFRLSSDAEPQLALTLNEIRVNEVAPDDLFPLERDSALLAREFAGIKAVGFSSAGPTRMGTWYALQLSSTKALVCWTQHIIVDGEVKWFTHEPTFSLAGKESNEALKVENLREFSSNAVRWRWSLISLSGEEQLTGATIHATVKYDGNSAFCEILPLQFPTDRLQEVFDVMQELTPSANGEKILTLDSVVR